MFASPSLQRVRSRRGRWAIAPLVFAMLGAWSGGASGEDLSIDASLQQTGKWDSNPFMTFENAKSVFSSVTTPTLSIARRTPTDEISAKASIVENVYSDDGLSSDDFHGSALVSTMTQRAKFALRGGIDYDTARTSELTTFGLVTKNDRHTNVTAAPSLAFSLSERDTLTFDASYARSSYESPQYTNYSTSTATSSLEHALSPLLSVFAGGQAQRYEAENAQKTRVDSLSPFLGTRIRLSEKLTLNAQGGLQASQQSYRGLSIGPGAWTWSNVFNASLSYHTQNNTLSLGGSRSQQPYANGTQSLLTTFNGSLTHALSEKLSLSFGGSYQFGDQRQGGSNIDYITSGSVGLTYHLTNEFALKISGQHKIEKLATSSALARQTIGILDLTLKTNWASP